MKKITLVTNNNDWCGFYIDGVLVAQEHQMNVEEFAALAGIDLGVVDMDPEWFAENGLPDKLEDVQIPKDKSGEEVKPETG